MSKINKKDKLTDKQRALADNYLAGMQARDAAVAAGYSKTSAHTIAAQTFAKPHVMEYMRTKLDKIDSKRVKTITEVQEWWGDLMDGKVKEVVTVDGVDIEKHPTLQERIKVSEDIVRSQAGFKDNVELSGGIDITVKWGE